MEPISSNFLLIVNWLVPKEGAEAGALRQLVQVFRRRPNAELEGDDFTAFDALLREFVESDDATRNGVFMIFFHEII